MYRSGELTKITEGGKSKLRELGIKKVFDFRAAREIRGYGSETPAIEGALGHCYLFFAY
jgi:hypothetical protein